MSYFIQNLGLRFLVETEESTGKLIHYVAQEGTPIAGYYGWPYLNKHCGDAQFILRTGRDSAEQNLHVTGIDTHSAGPCVWNARLYGITLTPKDADKMQRKCILGRSGDEDGMAVVNIVNADVLPSFLENDEVRLQMVAFPLTISYYRDEDEYADSQPMEEDGETWLVANGSVIPSGLLQNRNPENKDADQHPERDDYTLICGTVKSVYWGMTKFGEIENNSYIRCIIETYFGDLELIHTLDQVEKEQQKYIKEGCTVSGVFVLSGDAAIYEYEKGIVRDEEHNLRALRYTLVKGEAQRLGSILAVDALYVSDAARSTYRGRDAIIERLAYVAADDSEECFAQMAVITGVGAGADDLPEPRYAAGKRCVVLSTEREDNYVSIAFIETDGDGRITELHITTDARYRFRCDPKPKYEPL